MPKNSKKLSTSLEALEKEALKAAREEDWPKATQTNLKILKLLPQNTTTLNRLAWAYKNLGQIKKAKNAYKKVLRIDKNNLIANKNLGRFTAVRKDQPIVQSQSKKNPSLFLEEAGKTKVVSLIKLTSPKVLASLHCAQMVELVPRKKCISIKDRDNRYLGSLPDDISFRLLKLIKKGNQYQAWIKSIQKQNLKIFIRESKRSPKLQNLPSFPIDSSNHLKHKENFISY
jgi:hypothetical protein